jgi:hypothetical protein
MSSKQVTFGELTIHEHPLQLGDNPSCSSGAPLTIGWKAQSSSTRNLDLYEYMRGERRHGRKQLVIPVQERAQLLLESGYSLNKIADATMAVDEIKKQRSESLKGTNVERFGSLLKGMGNLVLKPVRNTVQARSA